MEEAIQVLRQTVAVAPSFAAAFKRLATALTVLGRTGEAAQVWQQWLENDPENPVPRHMLAAATGQAVPARAGDDFVRTTFDQFAEDFDEQLRRLEYRAPALIEEALRREGIAPVGKLDVLDVGCGTGWCGPFLRTYARRLVGVDLSPGMLEKARARTVYDELLAAELTRFLETVPAGFDLLVSADTLVYLGDLQQAFRVAARALRPAGWFFFTLERAQDEAAGDGFTLHALGRYSHTEAYVRSALIEAGLEVIGIARADLRKEAGTPVPGLIVTARSRTEGKRGDGTRVDRRS